MARKTEVTTVSVSDNQIRMLVAVKDEQIVDGEIQEVQLGEATLFWEINTPDPRMLADIKRAAAEIIARSEQAKAIRERLNVQLAAPEIPAGGPPITAEEP